MKTLKKWIAFMLAAGLIVSAVKVTAVTVLADSYSYTEKEASEVDMYSYDYSSGGFILTSSTTGKKTYYGFEPPATFDSGASWMDMNNFPDSYTYNGKDWVSYDGRIYSGSSSSLTPEEAAANAASQAAAEAENHAASDEGFLEVGDMYRAAEKNMSAGEYYNNVVISTPGIENAVTVGQGGNIVVNGVVTNMTAMISKVTNRAYVDSVRVNEPEGRILNVVEVSYPGFDATINFYMPSVTAEMDVVALQYSAGTWVEVDVAEVREDHVVLNMKKSGIVAFVAK